ncbi:hypothetical protein SDC9_160581 [bioreactor metagenome]|uniref:Uncharacterized protein n=1 Tax=bioreactor metagenome TaxID=1076179 RepID=A0A645FH14_9ZZZZ
MVIVIETIPDRWLSGVPVKLRLVPLPPKTIADLGIKAVLLLEYSMIISSAEWSTSVIEK